MLTGGGLAFLNPFARSGEGLRHNAIIKTELKGLHAGSSVVFAEDPIPNAAERSLRWQSKIHDQHPEILYPSGGDGTILEVAEAALKSNIQTTLSPVSDPRQFRFPLEVKKILGIGTGSAQDLKATFGFPKPEELSGYLAHSAQNETFKMGAVWMIAENAKGETFSRLINHSLSYGMVSTIFDLREEYYQNWKKNPDNAGKNVPVYLNTITGRFLQAPVAALRDGLRFLEGFRGHSVIVTMPDGTEKFFNDTAFFGVFGVPIAAKYFALPKVNPLAGEDFRVLVAALPYSPLVLLPLGIECFVRGTLVKCGFYSIAGSASEFISLKILNRWGGRLGLWNPDRIFTLTHDDAIKIEIADRVVSDAGGMDLVDHDGVAVINGDVAGVIRKAEIVIGPKEQFIPIAGRKKSLAGELSTKAK